MKYLICYDITEDKIRNKVVKLLESKAYRLQYSVFMGDMSAEESRALEEELLQLTAMSENRMLLLVPLCAACADRIWQVGTPREYASECIIA